MNRTFIRLVGLLLIPGLIADPLSAQGLTSFSASAASRLIPTALPIFTSQALAERPEAIPLKDGDEGISGPVDRAAGKLKVTSNSYQFLQMVKSGRFTRAFNRQVKHYGIFSSDFFNDEPSVVTDVDDASESALDGLEVQRHHRFFGRRLVTRGNSFTQPPPDLKNSGTVLLDRSLWQAIERPLSEQEERTLKEKYGDHLPMSATLFRESVGSDENPRAWITAGQAGQVLGDQSAIFCNYVVLWNPDTHDAVLLHVNRLRSRLEAIELLHRAIRLMPSSSRLRSSGQMDSLVMWIVPPSIDPHKKIVVSLSQGVTSLLMEAAHELQIPLVAGGASVPDYGPVRFFNQEGLLLALGDKNQVVRTFRLIPDAAAEEHRPYFPNPAADLIGPTEGLVHANGNYDRFEPAPEDRVRWRLRNQARVLMGLTPVPPPRVEGMTLPAGQTLGERILELRGKRFGFAISEADLAIFADIPRANISDIERGNRPSKTLTMRLKLANAFGVPLVCLLYPEQEFVVENRIVTNRTIEEIKLALYQAIDHFGLNTLAEASSVSHYTLKHLSQGYVMGFSETFRAYQKGFAILLAQETRGWTPRGIPDSLKHVPALSPRTIETLTPPKGILDQPSKSQVAATVDPNEDFKKENLLRRLSPSAAAEQKSPIKRPGTLLEGFRDFLSLADGEPLLTLTVEEFVQRVTEANWRRLSLSTGQNELRGLSDSELLLQERVGRSLVYFLPMWLAMFILEHGSVVVKSHLDFEAPDRIPSLSSLNVSRLAPEETALRASARRFTQTLRQKLTSPSHRQLLRASA